ncbi:hemerythrin domain-containing protein [Streptomyces sp. LBUM 1478]|uniref:Hemerythrin-like domain-containing protein n=6 Tax=Streptomyces TaxID=1883 RepID=C9ZE72_STRSW|nr:MULTISPECIES: hemerythrin domain-containing protein [Streptomyces]MBP5865221.1 hemerythrin domain-containing protein [Streptomyces sp. LBUM 1484]MBP5872317.1 hemerythrin domain-containing protein [Streptomyces sp. LBUM 1485]MBP5910137.1 hemerythrin domain-containing protein [Streptomyces sp. LBUM 1478]MBP5933282.1 hemerythrin domain-containing protein [Streptomyces sp. LBUM 1479]KFG05472.1 hemerythrin [Streptomyces scabiei]
MAHGGDVVEELKTDHREVEELFGKIEELPSGDSRRKEYADLVTIELVRHSVAEEAYLYPAVRRHVRNGDAVADRELADHTAAERTMKDLERCAADDPEFDRLIARLAAEIRHHVRDEESNLFPQLVKSCSAEVLNDLGDKVRRAKKLAPTRPHPSAPTKPPANKILAPGLGLVDRMRDALTGRGKES